MTDKARHQGSNNQSNQELFLHRISVLARYFRTRSSQPKPIFPLSKGIARNHPLLIPAGASRTLSVATGPSQTCWSVVESRAKVLATIAPSMIA